MHPELPTGTVTFLFTDVEGSTQLFQLNDFVALIGRHVCDTGHNAPCWDELHTLTGIAKIQ